MANAQIKVSELATLSNVQANDKFVVVRPSLGANGSRTVNGAVVMAAWANQGNLSANVLTVNTINVTSLVVSTNTLANAAIGSMAWDDNYIYVVVSDGTVKRVPFE